MLNKRQVRWLSTFADTPITITWRPGVASVVPDSLSRSHPQPAKQPNPTPAVAFPDAIHATYGTLDTILVEESFLARLSKAQFDTADSEMSRFVQLARSNDPYMRIIRKYNVDLLARQVDADAPPQLVIP